MHKIIFLYVVFSSKKEAQKIGEVLLREKLAFCVNILGKSDSLYLWKGKIEVAKETVVLIKTFSKNKKRAMQRIVELHSYDVPCVAELMIGSVNSDYGLWAEKEIK
jgi:periplasmic divalent cation tolerance protein